MEEKAAAGRRTSPGFLVNSDRSPVLVSVAFKGVSAYMSSFIFNSYQTTLSILGRLQLHAG